MISKDALKAIADIIAKYHSAITVKYAGSDSVSAEELSRLVREGILDQKDLTGSAIEDAWLMGRIREIAPDKELEKMSPEEFRSRFRGILSTLSDEQRKKLDLIKESARTQLVGLQEHVQTKIKSTLLNINFDNANEYLGEPVKNILQEAYIQDKSLAKLVKDLRKNAGDFSSRWTTIATTEYTKAINSSAADRMIEKNKDRGPEETYCYFLVVHDSKLCLEVNEEIYTKSTANLQRVGDLEVGNRVTGYININGLKQGDVKFNPKISFCEKRKAECIKIYLSDSSSIVCTQDHPVLIKSRGRFLFWEAGRLEDLRGLDYDVVNIKSIHNLKKLSYNLFASEFGDIWEFLKLNERRIVELWKNGLTQLDIYNIIMNKNAQSLNSNSQKLISTILYLNKINCKKMISLKNNNYNKNYMSNKSSALNKKYDNICRTNKDEIINDILSLIALKTVSKKYLGVASQTKRLKKFLCLWNINYRDVVISQKKKANNGYQDWLNSMSEQEKKLYFLKIKEKANLTMSLGSGGPCSRQQREIFNILKAAGYDVRLNYPCGNSLILDVALFDKKTQEKIDIEYDGNYWHQDKKKDFGRDMVVKSFGWKVLRIKGNVKTPPLSSLEEWLSILITNSINVIGNNFYEVYYEKKRC